MVPLRPRLRWLPFLAAAALFFGITALAAPKAQAQIVSVNGMRTAVAGGFLYSFSVTNMTSASIVVFSLDIPVNSTVTNLTPAPGFLGFYEPDPALNGSVPGRIDFIATGTGIAPAPSSPAGFSFQSTGLFSPSSITALDENGAGYSPAGGIVIFPGTTNLLVAPEPGSFALLALAGLPVAAVVVARRRAASRSLKG